MVLGLRAGPEVIFEVLLLDPGSDPSHDDGYTCVGDNVRHFRIEILVTLGSLSSESSWCSDFTFNAQG